MATRLMSSQLGDEPPPRISISRPDTIDTPSKPRKKRGRPVFDHEITLNGFGEELVEIPETQRKPVRPAKRLKTVGAEREHNRSANVRQAASAEKESLPSNALGVIRHRAGGRDGRIGQKSVQANASMSSGREPVLPARHKAHVPPEYKDRRFPEIPRSMASAISAAMKLNEIMQSPHSQLSDHSPSSTPSPDSSDVVPQSSMLGQPARIVSQKSKKPAASAGSHADERPETHPAIKKNRIKAVPLAKNDPVFRTTAKPLTSTSSQEVSAHRPPGMISPGALADGSRKKSAVKSTSKLKTDSKHKPSKSKSTVTRRSSSDDESVSERPPRAVSATKRKPAQVQTTSASNDSHGPKTTTSTATVTGAFSAEERRIVGVAFQQVLQEHSISETELMQDIADWRSARSSELKDLLAARLSGRSSDSIRKHCQRRYHTAQRGPWAEHEDAQLRRAYSQNKDKWSVIAASVGRRAEDCRDRWRDITSRTNQVTGPWSVAEEASLSWFVQELLAISQKKDSDMDESKRFINWNVISTKMNNTRSAKQCREHHQAMLTRPADQSQSTKRQRTLPKPEKDLKPNSSSSKAMTNFGPGDMYDAMWELANCVSDRSVVYPDPMTIWSICATKTAGSKFTTKLRRRVLQAFLSEMPQYEDLPPPEAAYKICLELGELNEGMDMKRKYVPPTKLRKKKVKSSSKVMVDEDGSVAGDDDGPGAHIPAESSPRATALDAENDSDEVNKDGQPSVEETAGHEDLSDIDSTDNSDSSDDDDANAQLSQELAASQSTSRAAIQQDLTDDSSDSGSSSDD